jgi:hypothetical protein
MPACISDWTTIRGWLETVRFADRRAGMGPTSGTPRRETEVMVVALVGDSAEKELKVVYYPIYATSSSPGACCIDLGLGDGRIVSGRAHSYFHALLEVRRQLEAMGIRLLCWGARSDVWPTGLEADMGVGLVVSRRTPSGAPMTHESIFSRIPKDQVSTVSGQEAFFQGILQAAKRRASTR